MSECERAGVCVFETEREREGKCVTECVCVYVCDRVRGGGCVRERVYLCGL